MQINNPVHVITVHTHIVTACYNDVLYTSGFEIARVRVVPQTLTLGGRARENALQHVRWDM